MGRLAALIRFFFACLLALVVISFAVSNRNTVTLSLLPLPWQAEMPLYLFGLLTLLIGFLWGSTHSIAERFAKHLQGRDDKRRIEALQAEVITLRAQKSAQEVQQTSPLLPSV